VNAHWLSSCSNGVQRAADLMRLVHVRATGFVQQLKGMLASPPAGGIEWADVFKAASAEGWAAFLEATQARQSAGARETVNCEALAIAASAADGQASVEDALAVNAEEDLKQVKANLMADARKEADVRLAAHVVPLTSALAAAPDVAITCVRTAEHLMNRGRMMGLFYCRADSVFQPYPGQNYYAAEAPVSESSLISFISIMQAIMKPSEDFCVVFEGKHLSNKPKVAQLLMATKWVLHPITLHYDKAQAERLFQSGATSAAKYGSRRRSKGFASLGLAETMWVCWRGKRPRNWEATWQCIAGGQALTHDILTGVPVVHPDELPRVEEEERMLVMTSFAASASGAAEPEEEEDDEESAAGATGVADIAPARKYA
jgi:hypothetical protein